MQHELIKDRIDAGFELANKLMNYKDSNSVVLAVPRGGVPIGYVISVRMHLGLDIVLSKKIPHPYNREYAIGAVSLLSQTVSPYSGVSSDYIEKEVVRLKELLSDKYHYYRGDFEPLSVEGKNVILVDDGIATGHTLLASITMLRKRNPLKIIVAVPVLPSEMVEAFEGHADELVYLFAAPDFRGVGSFYEDFTQVEDEDVIQMLRVAETSH